MDIFGVVDLPLWLVLICLLGLLFYWYATRPYSLFASLNIPGPKPIPLFGNLLTETKQGFHVAHQQWLKQYGNIVGFYEGQHPCMLVADKAVLKEIMVKQFNSFRNRRPLGSITGYPMSDGIMQQRDEDWKRSRSILTPTFSSAKLKQVCELVSVCSDTLVVNSRALAKEGREVELKDHFSAFTLDVIASSAFGLQIDSQSNPDDNFIKHAKSLTNIKFAGLLFMSYFLVPFVLPVFRLLNLSVAPKQPLDFFLKVVDHAVKVRQSGEETRTDLLQLMINAHDEDSGTVEPEDELSSSLQYEVKGTRKGLTSTEMLAHSVTFFLAGHETTSSAMSYVAYNLALHPHWQDRVAKEIDEILEQTLPTYDNVGKLPLLEMCVLESLRLYPPAVRFEREAADDIVINGVCIPKNTMVIAPVYAMNRDPDVFPDPDSFQPERFSAENKCRLGQCDFMPFGMGPRSCIGMRMAMVEAKMGLARMLQHFKFVRSARTQVPLTFRKSPLLQPEKGIWLQLEARK
ncbi:cytochrome P450 3A8-like [Haliotis rufescens]|uniref:cytochrome P450 3A8-like n=1 Tax=Haliotis rufescens TaxID=6454 RepID=UPI00201EBE37|nr:cytochrome P450 3A8-like [Haliotis rufescens]